MLDLLAVGPNPALQRVLRFDSLQLGDVNRASSVSQYVGGKGQGVALALRRFAPAQRTMLAHFLGGDSGRFVQEQLASALVEQLTEDCTAATRTCTTLLHDDSQTELIDPSGTVSGAEVSGLLARIDAALPLCRGVALCGTMPPGADSLYTEVAGLLAARDAELGGAGRLTLMLDGHKAVGGCLDSGRVDVLKLNAAEITAMTGKSTVEAAASELLRKPGAPLSRPGALVAVTDGPRPARLFSTSAAWSLRVPAIEAVNAIGAGDVCTAVFLHTLTARRAGMPLDGEDAAAPSHADEGADAFAWGLAAGCARCLKELPDFDAADVRKLREAIVIEPCELI